MVQTNPHPSPDRVEELLVVRLLNALAHDCDETDGWQDAAATVLEAASLITVMREALEAIKELADADETFLCWKTANDALEALTRIGCSE